MPSKKEKIGTRGEREKCTIEGIKNKGKSAKFRENHPMKGQKRQQIKRRYKQLMKGQSKRHKKISEKTKRDKRHSKKKKRSHPESGG